MTTFLVLFHSPLTSCPIGSSQLQPDLSLPVSTPFVVFLLLLWLLCKYAPTQEPLSAYISTYSQALKQKLKQPYS